jgi:hypothetical protein
MAYGLEVYSSGNTKIVTIDSRCTRVAASGTTASISNGGFASVTVTGMSNIDSWQVFVSPNSSPSSTLSADFYTVKGTNAFSVFNDMGVSSTFDYFVIRSG